VTGFPAPFNYSLTATGTTTNESHFSEAIVMRVFSRLVVVAAGALTLLMASQALAHLIIFKDGFMLQGDVKQPGTRIEGLPVSEGTFVLDAGARRIFFPHTRVEDVVPESNPNADLVTLETKVLRLQPQPVDSLEYIVDATPFDEKWRRYFRYRVPDRVPVQRVPQQLAFLNPLYARVDAISVNWDQYYLTNEFDPATVRKLLVSHQILKMKGDAADAGKRFRIYRFFVQAGWYDTADEELTGILQDFPSEKERVDASRESLNKARVGKQVEDLERGYRIGRHAWVQQQLANFPTSGLDDPALTTIRTLKSRYQEATERLTQWRRWLEELPGQIKEPEEKKLFDEAAAAILKEIRLDDCLPPQPGQGRYRSLEQGRLLRLDAFGSMAAQVERDRKQGRPPTNSPTELLGLAVSGWLLGKDAAETNLGNAQKLWQARQFVLKYQKTPDDGDRERLMKEYQAVLSRALGTDEMAQLISLLPPCEPEADLSSEAVELQTRLPWQTRRTTAYLLQLPPEYHHGRSSPVLFALPQVGEQPRIMLERCGELAAKFGYILVVPDWKRQGVAYDYTTEEQLAVTDVLLDLRRRFQVDSDRVFLLGFGEGASMALDVGLSHPDLFAGVIPVCPGFRFFPQSYWRNGQYLPFYVVVGDQARELNKKIFEMFRKQWVPRGFPWLLVQYRGRGLEWFQGELPFIFDWMEHKRDRYRRSTAVPELGKLAGAASLSLEFQSMRKTDNHFYWLSSDGISDKSINHPANWSNNVYPASFQGSIFLEQNSIHVTVHNLRQLTIWLSRDMIDFTKPVTINVNGVVHRMNKKIDPSLPALMEDFYTRSDRQRLFFARVDINRP
jgi:pimeloyl-ACP methyl ester carboxylesterase